MLATRKLPLALSVLSRFTVSCTNKLLLGQHPNSNKGNKFKLKLFMFLFLGL